MYLSADGCLMADVIGRDPDTQIRIWLWSSVGQQWRWADDVDSPEELARFVNLGTLSEVTTGKEQK